MSDYSPYAASGSQPAPPLQANPGLPTFSVVWLIIDIVLCVLRGLATVASVFAFLLIEPGDAGFAILLAEVVVGLLIAVTGITGNSLVLARKPVGIPICWATVGLTVLGILVSLAQLPMQIEDNPAMDEAATRIGMFVGAGVTFLIRIGFLIAYIYAVKMAAAALRDTHRPTA